MAQCYVSTDSTTGSVVCSVNIYGIPGSFGEREIKPATSVRLLTVTAIALAEIGLHRQGRQGRHGRQS